MGERTLLLGYDLCDKKTQLAVYNWETLEPELVGQTDENPEALVDTAVELEDGTVITDFLPKIRRGEEVSVSNSVNLLACFFRRTLSMTKRQYPSETIKQLVVTVQDNTPVFSQIIYDALEALKIGRDRAVVLSHKQSYLYFSLYQKKELWANDVGMFDYCGDSLKYYQMQIDRRRTPFLVRVAERDYSSAIKISEDMAEEKKGSVFENIVLGAIHRQILSVLYMTGDGFDGGWAEESFKNLCVGRRLFKGGNLYVSGACYAAKEYGDKPLLTDFLLMDDDMTTSTFSVRVYADAKMTDVIIARAGIPWYQVDEEIELIPDGEGEIAIRATNIFTREEREFLVELDPVSGKVDRHCRLGVRIRFADVRTCVVTVRDRGFGNLFPTSNRIWEKLLRVDDREVAKQ